MVSRVRLTSYHALSKFWNDGGHPARHLAAPAPGPGHALDHPLGSSHAPRCVQLAVYLYNTLRAVALFGSTWHVYRTHQAMHPTTATEDLLNSASNLLF